MNLCSPLLLLPLFPELLSSGVDEELLKEYRGEVTDAQSLLQTAHELNNMGKLDVLTKTMEKFDSEVENNNEIVEYLCLVYAARNETIFWDFYQSKVQVKVVFLHNLTLTSLLDS